MKFSETIVPLLCALSPFIFGWIFFSVVVGIRGGWEASVRLFQVGLGFLGAGLAILALIFVLPAWAIIPLVITGAFLPWMILLRYYLYMQLGGKLLMALSSSKKEEWLSSIMSGATSVIFGILLFRTNNDFLTPPKPYALGVFLISWGIFKAIDRIRYSQVREKGILHAFGNFYKWGNIESYAWKFGEDKLTLKLKKSISKRVVDLKLPSQFRQDIVAHLSQKLDGSKNDIQGYVPIQKAG